METERTLTDKERGNLYIEIWSHGKFTFKGNIIERADIADLQLFPDNCLLNEKDYMVSFKGGCQFTEHCEAYAITCPTTFNGTAEMRGLNEFILSQIPISIKK